MRRAIVLFAVAAAVGLAGRLGAQTHHHHGGGGGALYRGGIAFNDYGYGPSGGHYHHGAHTQPGWSALQRYGGFNNYGYYNNYNYGYNNYGYGRGYGYYYPSYYNSGIYLGVGYPYYGSSFGYYGGPIVNSYYSPYLGGYYGGLNYYYPNLATYNYVVPPAIDPGPAAAPAEVETLKPVVKEIDWDARKKADNYMELGDVLFKQQKFHDALLRYRMAVAAAPDYPMAYLKHGVALIAQRRYEEASQAFAKAFALDPKIIESGFRIDQLYADNRLAREGHEEALAQAALDDPDNSALHFDLGMWLVFNGQAERSRKFFERARDLGMKPPAAAPAENAVGARDL
jgi:tetratricopeptide (TPR) repeat protein